MDNLIIGGHGIGDCILAIQCASLAEVVSKERFALKFATRDEVFNPLKYFFKDVSLTQITEALGENNSILNNFDYLHEQHKEFENVYYVIPDLLFRNPFAFNFRKYNLSLHVIKQHRLSLKDWKPKRKIYLGLVTVSEFHRYGAIKPLLKLLSKRLPNHEIYFPNLKSWNKEALDWGDLSKLPDNVFVHEDPKFEDSIDHLRESCFGVFADNGPSHFAYHLGMPRIVLDNFIDDPKWLCRWREDSSESVSLKTNVLDLVDMIEAQISCPQSSLIPRKMCRTSLGVPDLLGFKY